MTAPGNTPDPPEKFPLPCTGRSHTGRPHTGRSDVADSSVPDMAATGWHVVDGVPTAWFDAPSLSAGAALSTRIGELSQQIVVDVRRDGIRVRLDDEAHAAAVSVAAQELGLTANPAALQAMSIVLETANPAGAAPFWQRALGYPPAENGELTDPMRNDPGVPIRRSDDPRPLRNRIHLDVVRPAELVERADLGAASGPFGVRHTDPDGNEVDLMPGEALGAGSDCADWQQVSSAMACYRTTSPGQRRDLVIAAALAEGRWRIADPEGNDLVLVAQGSAAPR